MGWARFTWRRDGALVTQVGYVTGLNESDARASNMWIMGGSEFVSAEWLSDEEAAATERVEMPCYTAWRERQAS